MIKFRFDEEKKKRFLQFWKIKEISDFEKLDDIDFAFILSNLYNYRTNDHGKKGVVFSQFAVLISHCLKNNLIQLKNDRLVFKQSISFFTPFQSGDAVLQLLDDLNLVSKLLDRKQLQAESKDKVSFPKRMTDFLSAHRLLSAHRPLPNFLNLPDFSNPPNPPNSPNTPNPPDSPDSSNLPYPPDSADSLDGTGAFVDLKDFLEINPLVKKIAKPQKETAFLHKMLIRYQGIALSSLNYEKYREAVRELVEKGVGEIVLLGFGCLPALLLVAEQKENVTDDEELQQKVLLATSYLKRKFCKNLLSVELFFYQKYMPTQISCKFLSKSQESQKAFLQKEVFPQFEKLVLKNDLKNNLEKNILSMPKFVAEDLLKKVTLKSGDKVFSDFKKKVYLYVTAGMGKYVSIFFELVSWFTVFLSKKQLDLNNTSVLELTELELFSSINRYRFFQGKRLFSWSFFKRGFHILRRLGLVNIVSNRLVFLSEVFVAESIHPLNIKSRVTIDSDMTMLAFAQDISLEDIYFFSLFSTANYTEYTIKFTPNPAYASLAWCNGLNGNKVVEKFKQIASETFNEKVEHYFFLYFEHAKVARLDKLSVIFFSSQNFFLAAKHALGQFLKDHPHEKENFFILEEKKGFLFLQKSTKKAILQFLMEKQFLKGGRSKKKLNSQSNVEKSDVEKLTDQKPDNQK